MRPVSSNMLNPLRRSHNPVVDGGQGKLNEDNMFSTMYSQSFGQRQSI